MKWGGGGYVTGLVFHPTTANLLYARTDIGGAYRWNQAGASWTPITDGLGFGAAESRYHGIESIAVDPNSDQLVSMATGMYTSDGNGRAISRSVRRASDLRASNSPSRPLARTDVRQLRRRSQSLWRCRVGPVHPGERGSLNARQA